MHPGSVNRPHPPQVSQKKRKSIELAEKRAVFDTLRNDWDPAGGVCICRWWLLAADRYLQFICDETLVIAY